jgi:hypothetical protein
VCLEALRVGFRRGLTPEVGREVCCVFSHAVKSLGGLGLLPPESSLKLCRSS